MGAIASPITRSGNGFSYLASATNGVFGAGSTADAWLSPLFFADSLGYNPTSSNVRGVGG
jgi:hypothetical protein